jgi:hypothetical protein
MAIEMVTRPPVMPNCKMQILFLFRVTVLLVNDALCSWPISPQPACSASRLHSPSFVSLIRHGLINCWNEQVDPRTGLGEDGNEHHQNENLDHQHHARSSRAVSARATETLSDIYDEEESTVTRSRFDQAEEPENPPHIPPSEVSRGRQRSRSYRGPPLNRADGHMPESGRSTNGRPSTYSGSEDSWHSGS